MLARRRKKVYYRRRLSLTSPGSPVGIETEMRFPRVIKPIKKERRDKPPQGLDEEERFCSDPLPEHPDDTGQMELVAVTAEEDSDGSEEL